MKKSELKQLIKEVLMEIKEVDVDPDEFWDTFSNTLFDSGTSMGKILAHGKNPRQPTPVLWLNWETRRAMLTKPTQELLNAIWNQYIKLSANGKQVLKKLE